MLSFLIFQSTSFSQEIRSVDQDGLFDILSKKTDTVYVINFWATWCSPCVKELPYFEELHKSAAGRKLQVILVNLDFPNQLEKRVYPFVKEKNISATVLNMTSLDYNAWISEVDESWSGAIPATLIFRNEKRKFFSTELSRDELFETVQEFINN